MEEESRRSVLQTGSYARLDSGCSRNSFEKLKLREGQIWANGREAAGPLAELNQPFDTMETERGGRCEEEEEACWGRSSEGAAGARRPSSPPWLAVIKPHLLSIIPQ